MSLPRRCARSFSINWHGQTTRFLCTAFLLQSSYAFTKIDSLVLALMTTSLVAMLLGDTNITRIL